MHLVCRIAGFRPIRTRQMRQMRREVSDLQSLEGELQYRVPVRKLLRAIELKDSPNEWAERMKLLPGFVVYMDAAKTR